MPDVVVTMLLSRRWRHLWTTVPCLDFVPTCPPTAFAALSKFQNFVSGALAHWKGSKILNFRISHDIDYMDSDVVDSCVLLAVENQVEEMVVDVGGHPNGYCPPQRLYSCSSLTKLYLCCLLEIKEEIIVQWDRLKCLTIRDQTCLTEHAVNQILSGAPLLEELVLGFLEIRGRIVIKSTSLMKLQMGSASSDFKAALGIWAPNLLSFEIAGLLYGGCLLYVPSLANAALRFHDSSDDLVSAGSLQPLQMYYQIFQSISHVEKLTLSDLSMQFLLDMKAKGMAVEFSKAKFVNLQPTGGDRLLGVLDMFPHLTTLHVELDKRCYYSLDAECLHHEVDVA